MFVLGNLFEALAVVSGYAIELFWWLIIIRALLSWVSPDPSNPIVQFIERATEPLLRPFRQLIPSYKLGIDISPILAILFLYFLKVFLVKTLMGLAFRFR
jgi:YggT family protein